MEQIYEENSTLSPDISEEKFMIKDAVEHIAWKKSKLLNSILRGTVYGQLYNIVQNSSVSIKLKCDHSNESYWAVLSCGTVYYAVQGGSNF